MDLKVYRRYYNWGVMALNSVVLAAFVLYGSVGNIGWRFLLGFVYTVSPFVWTVIKHDNRNLGVFECVKRDNVPEHMIILDVIKMTIADSGDSLSDMKKVAVTKTESVGYFASVAIFTTAVVGLWILCRGRDWLLMVLILSVYYGNLYEIYTIKKWHSVPKKVMEETKLQHGEVMIDVRNSKFMCSKETYKIYERI